MSDPNQSTMEMTMSWGDDFELARLAAGLKILDEAML